MKVIDEKGKLFGKLNIIDLLVIVLIIAVVAVLGVKLMGNDQNFTTSSAKLTYTVRVTAQEEELVECVAEYVDSAAGKKDQLMADGRLLNGYVVDYWTEPTRYNKTVAGELEFIDAAAAVEAGLVDICFTIEVDVGNIVTNEVGTQEVRIGKEHIVKTAHLEFTNGIVESCTWETTE